MPFKYSASGIPEFTSLPDGMYLLKITSAVVCTTQNADDKVTVDYVVADGQYAGRKVRFHTVTFFVDKERPGAGISVHYLRCIGEPYEGDFEVREDRWIGRMVKAKLVSEKSDR